MVILDERDIVYGVLPYFHAGGLLTVFCMLVQGVQLLINRKFDGTKFLETIEKYKVLRILELIKNPFTSSIHSAVLFPKLKAIEKKFTKKMKQWKCSNFNW